MASKEKRSILTNFDAFEKSVGMTIKGRDTYKSNCGGLATIAVFFLVIGYMVILVTQPLKYKAGISTMTTTTTVDSNTTDTTNTTDTGLPSTDNLNSGNAGSTTIGDIDYVGTYSTRKSNLYHNVSFDTNSYYPQNNGLMFAVDFTSNFQNYSEMFFEFYNIVPNENGTGRAYQYVSPVP